MKASKATIAIPLSAIESLRALEELGARLGGEYKLGAAIIAAGLANAPDERLSRRDAALADLALHYRDRVSDRDQARAMASALLQYEATLWRRERMGGPALIRGAEGAALFAVLRNSPASGAPKEKTIRTVLGKTLGLSVAHRSIHHPIRSIGETDGV